MKRVCLAALTLSLAMPGAAAAQDVFPGFAGLRGSLAFATTVSTNVPGTPATALKGKSDLGGGGSLYYGMRLGNGFRVELEGLYLNLPFDSATINGGASVPAHSRARIGAPLVNLMWAIPVDFPVQPFVGAGIGGAYVSDFLRGDGTLPFQKASSWQLAYNAMAGFALPLSETSRFTAMYRWLHVDGPDGQCGIGPSNGASVPCKANLSSNGVNFGVEMDLP